LGAQELMQAAGFIRIAQIAIRKMAFLPGIIDPEIVL